jgi:YidC/Oxa1 family membrane protein insertase
MQNNQNVLLATILSAIVLIGWTWFYEKPRIEKKEQQEKELALQINKENSQKNLIDSKNNNPSIKSENHSLKPVNGKQENKQELIINVKSREEFLLENKNNRIVIENESLHGSISLKGLRFDDLTLAKYFETTKKDREVILFSPAETKERYFADFGWISSDSSIELPKPETIWKADQQKLTATNSVTFSWENNSKIKFIVKVSLDNNYMFDIEQIVENKSGKEILVAPFGRINRILNNIQKPVYILHEGLIGVFDSVLQEKNYKDLIKEKNQSFSNSKKGDWFGITDKYWLASIIPAKDFTYQTNFDYYSSNQNNFFNANFIGQEFKVNSGEKLKFQHHLFAGAKKVKLLDQYSQNYDITLFDRAVDFGWFYFLTKPFFFIIEFLSRILGNFGLAILMMTVLVKLALFPMANKSYLAIANIKKLQPKIDEIRERFRDDKLAMNKAIMEFYKKEKINPASGCLPILIQIPIFFSLYKVLYVTLDMRHAPFYGWINDLSAPDLTSIFNLFGLLPYQVTSTFTIGIWPILMGITMIIQQKLSPPVSDPTQAKVLKWMPYVLTFALASFPAGLLIYWTWSNLLSILQQLFITKKLGKKSSK